MQKQKYIWKVPAPLESVKIKGILSQFSLFDLYINLGVRSRKEKINRKFFIFILSARGMVKVKMRMEFSWSIFCARK
jgi:hypothetical protein